MIQYTLKAGATSQIIPVSIYDSSSTTGAKLTGLVYNSAGLTAYYNRTGASGSATSITLATATKGTWATGGFVAIDGTNMPGDYELHIPDAAIAAGATSVLVQLKGATNMVPVNILIALEVIDRQDAVRMGLTALPNANAEAAGGLYTRGTGAGQINQPANGQIDCNTVKLSGTSCTARDIGASVLLSAGTGTGQLDFTSGVVKANLAQILGTALTETAGQIANAFKKFFNVSSPTGTVNSIPDAVAGASGGLLIAGSNAATTVNITGNITGNLSGSVGSVTGSVGSVTGAVGSVTGNVGGNVVGSVGSVTGAVGSVTAAVTVGTNNDKTGYSLSSSQTFNLTGNITGNLSGSVGSVTGAVGSVTGAVGSVTGNVGGNVVGSVGSVTGSVGSVTGAVGSVTGNVGGNVVGSVASVTGAVGSVTGNVGGNVTGSVGSLGATAKTDAENAVWNATLASHLTAGSTGSALNASGSAGDPWITPIPGAYTAGQAGYIVGNLLSNIFKTDLSTFTGEASRSLLNAIRALRNRVSISPSSGAVTVYKEDDSTSAWTATASYSSSAQSVVEVDPT